MIAFVRGRVAAVSLSSAVLEVGGVGLELICTPATLAGLRHGDEATLPTSMVVREDSMTLFGFADEDEKTIFEMVQTASGVGPKVAQAILAVLTPDGVRTAIAGEDAKTLTKVPGIGQKGAQRIILELKDRIGAPTGSRAGHPVAAASAPWRDQVHQGSWASATARRTPRRRSTRSRRRPRPPGEPRTSARCCARHCAPCPRPEAGSDPEVACSHTGRDERCRSERMSSKPPRRPT